MKSGTIGRTAALLIGTLPAVSMAMTASADFVGWHFETNPVVVDGEVYSVVDVYAQFDDATDTVLNVFNGQISNLDDVPFHQDDLASLAGGPGSWSVQQTADNEDLGLDSANDSFVLVGGTPGSGNSTALDPSFDPPTAASPPDNGGWFNSNPPNLQGRVDPITLRTMVARFVTADLSSGKVLSWAANLGYNQGLGTPAEFAFEDVLGSGPTSEVAYASCDDLTVDPASSGFDFDGGEGLLSIVVADDQCPWAADASDDWIVPASPAAGIGSGSIAFTVAPNDSAIPRSGSISVNGAVHSIAQDAAPCAVTGIDAPAADYPLEGGTGSFTISTNGPDCSWNAFSSAAWVTITEGGSGSGESGVLSYSVAANPNAFKRTAVIVVGTQSHTILQSPAPCAVSAVDPASVDVEAGGGDGGFTVSTNGAVCSWQATSSASWITITAGAEGTGSSGEIAYAVEANPVAVGRVGEIAVGGLVHAIAQAAAPCEVVSISGDSTSVAFEGGTGGFEVATNGAPCEWTATTSADWIVLDAGSGGGVVSTLAFTVLANELAEPRTGSIEVGGFVHAVTQDAAPCAVTGADPNVVDAGSSGGAFSVAIATNGPSCAWSATTAASWIALDSAGGVGDGVVEFTIAANPVTVDRVGSIEIEGVVVTVLQAALPCAVASLDPNEAEFDFAGGDLDVAVSTNGDNCDWSASTDVDWISIVDGGSGSGSSGTISLEIAIHDGVDSRFGAITVGSQTLSIVQTGGADCNGNGLGDGFEILEGLAPDCNGNGAPDSCDLADATSEDLNGNGIPDECEQDLVVSVPGDYPTIQDAIDGSLDGWTIQVAPGTYNERIALGNRRIVVEALAGLGETVLDGDGLPGSVVTMIAPDGNTEPGPTLRGFTITGGTEGSPIGTTTNFGGGGIYLAYSFGEIDACTIEGNSAPLGGGLYAFYGGPTIAGCVFRSNLASASFGGGATTFRNETTFVGCLFESNFTPGQAGGLHLARGQTSVIDCTFVDNESLGPGGGISYFAVEDSTLLLSGVHIAANMSSDLGGGLWVRPGYDNAFIENSFICSNEPDEIAGDFTDLGGNELCICPADLTGNGVVNGADLAELLAVWGGCGDACSAADFNGDGVVDGADLSVVLSAWGECPDAAGLPWATVVEYLPDPAIVVDFELRTAIIATGLPWRVVDDATGIEMLLVPPGVFDMGCSPSLEAPCVANEFPVHEVELTEAFYLGRFEVTQAQWTEIVGSNPSYYDGLPDSPERPVEQVTWNSIQDFEALTGLRLPTEAEWEFACRAGTTSAFNNGSDDDATLDDIAWWVGNDDPIGTKVVGLKSANALGLHDMSGNVWEWVEDRYAADYYQTSPSVNPPGPASGEDRVLRGGRWLSPSTNCRSSRRFFGPPDEVIFDFGFRAARNP